MALAFRQTKVEGDCGRNLLAASDQLHKGGTEPEWLANLVFVSKKNGKWKMCIDYMNLDEACPMDPIPLSHIDQVVDLTARCESPLLSGHVLWVPSDWNGPLQSARDLFHNPIWLLLLCFDALQFVECLRHLSMMHA